MRKKNSRAAPHQTPAPRLPPIVGSETAPVIYAEGCIGFGTLHGLVQLELAANISIPISDGSARVETKTVVVAHLRLTPRALQTLIDGGRGAIGMIRAEHEQREKLRAAENAKKRPGPAPKPAAAPVAAAPLEEQFS